MLDRDREYVEEFKTEQVSTFYAALKEGKLPFQPRMGTKNNSFCDTYLARDVVRDHDYQGINQIMFKINQREKGYKTGDYLTVERASHAYKYYKEKNGKSTEENVSLKEKEIIYLKEESVPVYILIKNKGTPDFLPLYNIESFEHPEQIREYSVYRHAKMREYIKENFLEDIREYEAKPKIHNGVIVCKSTDPIALIGQWKAACQLGKDFKVTPKQNKEFVKKCENFIWRRRENEKLNTYESLKILMDESDKYCKDFMPTAYQKKKPERAKASPGMGM